MIEQVLLKWYASSKRDLPWRNTTDPYAIWISEIMLQQTQVVTVIPYYERFLKTYPDVKSLADAEEERVLSLWKGLGYYTRARNLHRAAQMIRDLYNGIFPDAYENILELPGIGEYTAGAIASIAFNKAYPAVDGNVLRVMARLYGIEEDISAAKVKKQITEIVSEMMNKVEIDEFTEWEKDDQKDLGRYIRNTQRNRGDFTQALMELGATCCTPKNPQCIVCPVKHECAAEKTGAPELLPVKKKAKAAVELDYTAAVIIRDGALLMEYRHNTQLLGKMWGLPLFRKDPVRTVEELMHKEWGWCLNRAQTLGQVKHVFSHQVWQMEVVIFNPLSAIDSKQQAKIKVLSERKGDQEITGHKQELYWIPIPALNTIPIPKAFQRVLEIIAETKDYFSSNPTGQ